MNNNLILKERKEKKKKGLAGIWEDGDCDFEFRNTNGLFIIMALPQVAIQIHVIVRPSLNHNEST